MIFASPLLPFRYSLFRLTFPLLFLQNTILLLCASPSSPPSLPSLVASSPSVPSPPPLPLRALKALPLLSSDSRVKCRLNFCSSFHKYKRQALLFTVLSEARTLRGSHVAAAAATDSHPLRPPSWLQSLLVYPSVFSLRSSSNSFPTMSPCVSITSYYSCPFSFLFPYLTFLFNLLLEHTTPPSTSSSSRAASSESITTRYSFSPSFLSYFHSSFPPVFSPSLTTSYALSTSFPSSSAASVSLSTSSSHPSLSSFPYFLLYFFHPTFF